MVSCQISLFIPMVLFLYLHVMPRTMTTLGIAVEPLIVKDQFLTAPKSL